MQYLLVDPPGGDFASGLGSSNGALKPSFTAFRMPLYLPVTSTKPGRKLEVWGDVRPAHFAGPGQSVQIQFRRGSSGSFTTLETVKLSNSQGYFDVKLAFPASGAVRLLWTPPSGAAEYSRYQNITIH